MLMSVHEYRMTHFTEASRPDIRTIKRWIDEGHLQGKKIGVSYYVDISAENNQTGDELADNVLNSAQ